MPRNIEKDHKHFIDVISGKLRKELKKFFSTGKFVKARSKGGRMNINYPQIDIPHVVYGDDGYGLKRGPGKEGDVIGKDPEEGTGGAGNESADGTTVSIDQNQILDFMAEYLKLPDLKPKPNATFEEVRIKYNDISLHGPQSLRHNKRTMLQALKRLAATGELDKLHYIPGCKDPVKLITPINKDRRYRQYKEIHIPSSNAAIMFGRDGSLSMDEEKCEIVSDMAYWIDAWIRRFYKRVERSFFWHDTVCKEVDEETFYNYRYGGGTNCSTCPKEMAKQLENRFPPQTWNIYCFYFTDGDNWDDDNPIFLETIRKQFPPEICNLFAITQVLSWNYKDSLKCFMDDAMRQNPMSNYRSASIGPEIDGNVWSKPNLTDDERNEAIKEAIKTILGAEQKAFAGDLI